MNKDCGIVRDLMPLVIDDVAGDESKEFVETHLTACEECKKLYQEMKTDLPVETEKEEGAIQKAFSAAAEKLKKKTPHPHIEACASWRTDRMHRLWYMCLWI